MCLRLIIHHKHASTEEMTETSPSILDVNQLTNELTQILTPYIEQKHCDPNLDWLFPTIRKAIIEAALIHHHGNQSQAAKLLGIHRQTLRRVYRA